MSAGAPVSADLAEVDGLIRLGSLADARRRLRLIEPRAQNDVGLTRALAEKYLASQGFEEASRLYDRAVTLDPGDALLWHSLAASRLSFGDKEGAEAAIDRAIELDPRLSNAWYFRSTIRKQTPERNHVDALQRALPAMDTRGQAALHYALGKELEDLGDHDRAFASLERGAAIRRAGLSYQVAGDVAMFGAIADTFTAAWRGQAGPGDPRDDAIFVMGLPRSGTTLVESILAAHPAVESKGEITDYAVAIMDLAGAVRSRAELLAATARMDMRSLGARFLARVDAQGRRTPRFVDKTPHNYLYVGLIDASLPNAAVVHVRRHPMDSCYALFKTWFNMAAPFSYALSDLAEYYIAYDRLMAHWRSLAPARLLDLQYEDLVADQTAGTATLLAHCGLDWNDACLDFHKGAAPVATASAAQVRSPIYRTSVALWRRYERQLAPLADRLAAAGIAID